MSHAALVSEVLPWFMVVLALLVTSIAAVAWTFAKAARSPQPPVPSLPVPSLPVPLQGAPPPVGRRPPAAVPATAAAQFTGAGYRPASTDAFELGLAVVVRPKVSGAPPWGPAPRPKGLGDQQAPPRPATSGQRPGKADAYQALWRRPVPAPDAGRTPYPAHMTGRPLDRLRSAQTAQGRPTPSGRPAHRRTGRHGAHRAGSSGRARGPGGHAGRHRAAAHLHRDVGDSGCERAPSPCEKRPPRRPRRPHGPASAARAVVTADSIRRPSARGRRRPAPPDRRPSRRGSILPRASGSAARRGRS
jgi:hypothetical protein